MQKIVRRVTITLYKCSVCKQTYSNKKEAAHCEDRIREKKLFRVGATVRNKEPRFCQIKSKHYRFSGKIVRILGPKPSDYEYETKWLGGKRERVNGHIFLYEVKFCCPYCKEIRREQYHTPELLRIRR